MPEQAQHEAGVVSTSPIAATVAHVSNWTRRRLSDLAHYYNGIAFKPADWGQDGLPIIRIEQINNPRGTLDRYIGPVMEVNRVRDGDLIFSWSATLKVVIWQHGEAVLNQHLFKVVPKPGFDIRFTYFVLDYYMGELGGGSHGSTMKHIKRSELDKFVVCIPDRTTQVTIATILTAIDNAIEKNEALIDKYQQIKAGMMHDLFTRGVLPNGQLRPSRDQAPELYQETAIGWIPKEWSVSKLGTMAKIVSGVTLGARSEPSDTVDAPYLRVANVQDGYLDLTEIKTVRISRTTLEYLRLQPGDVLMNEGGDFDKLGRGAVWAGEVDDCVHQNHVFRVRADANALLPHYLAFYSESSFGKRYFLLSSKQSTNLASINSTQLNAYPIARPSVAEQDQMVKRVNAAKHRIKALRSEAEKLGRQKLGLMQDLLTGKVPVRVDQAVAEAADG